MSSQRVRKPKQFFPIESYSYDSANSIATIVANTAFTDLLYANASIYLDSQIRQESYKSSVKTISGNTFTASVPVNQYIQTLTHFSVDGYLPGQTGGQVSHTLPRGTGCDTVIQSYVSGSGGASYSIELSLDTEHWISFASVSHGTNDGNTSAVFIAPGWAYMRANLSSVGANTNLVLMTSE